jgi:hypothetical protein
VCLHDCPFLAATSESESIVWVVNIAEVVWCLAVAAGGGTQVFLAHVRRWKHDKLFFKLAKKAFRVEDVTNGAGPGYLPASDEDSHTKGALRIYELTAFQTMT